MKGELKKHIRQVAVVFIILFLVLIVHISYIQVIEGSFYAWHPLNQRSNQSNIVRGSIVDRNGQLLAVSKQDGDKGIVRSYPYGAAFAHTVGYDSVRLGKAGLESAYNAELSGSQHPLKGLGPIGRLAGGGQGSTLMLTLDARVQKAAQQALGSNRGAIIVVNPQSGAILAMVSKPDFDPNQVDSQWSALSGSTASPLLNRAVSGLYPPGSIIKPLFADAALTERLVKADTLFECDGRWVVGTDYTLTESGGRRHGTVNLSKALAVSCNITFGKIAVNLGNTKVENTFRRFGFEQKTPVELQEAASHLPDFGALGSGDLAQTGIGQGSLLVTPLRMAMLAATFANHGITMRPYIVERVTTAGGSVITSRQPQEWLKPTDVETARAVRTMMVGVVENGTAAAARIAGVAVAGKTGTAENPHGADHAWFIGFAPAEHPQVAIAVIVENGGAGSTAAVPIARQILVQALR